MMQDGAARRAVQTVKRALADLAQKVGRDMKRHHRRVDELEKRVARIEDMLRDR